MQVLLWGHAATGSNLLRTLVMLRLLQLPGAAALMHPTLFRCPLYHSSCSYAAGLLRRPSEDKDFYIQAAGYADAMLCAAELWELWPWQVAVMRQYFEQQQQQQQQQQLDQADKTQQSASSSVIGSGAGVNSTSGDSSSSSSSSRESGSSSSTGNSSSDIHSLQLLPTLVGPCFHKHCPCWRVAAAAAAVCRCPLPAGCRL
jgi:hypothetical protein